MNTRATKRKQSASDLSTPPALPSSPSPPKRLLSSSSNKKQGPVPQTPTKPLRSPRNSPKNDLRRAILEKNHLIRNKHLTNPPVPPTTLPLSPPNLDSVSASPPSSTPSTSSPPSASASRGNGRNRRGGNNSCIGQDIFGFLIECVSEISKELKADPAMKPALVILENEVSSVINKAAEEFHDKVVESGHVTHSSIYCRHGDAVKAKVPVALGNRVGRQVTSKTTKKSVRLVDQRRSEEEQTPTNGSAEGTPLLVTIEDNTEETRAAAAHSNETQNQTEDQTNSDNQSGGNCEKAAANDGTETGTSATATTTPAAVPSTSQAVVVDIETEEPLPSTSGTNGGKRQQSIPKDPLEIVDRQEILEAIRREMELGRNQQTEQTFLIPL